MKDANKLHTNMVMTFQWKWKMKLNNCQPNTVGYWYNIFKWNKRRRNSVQRCLKKPRRLSIMIRSMISWLWRIIRCGTWVALVDWSIRMVLLRSICEFFHHICYFSLETQLHVQRYVPDVWKKSFKEHKIYVLLLACCLWRLSQMGVLV